MSDFIVSHCTEADLSRVLEILRAAEIHDMLAQFSRREKPESHDIAAKISQRFTDPNWTFVKATDKETGMIVAWGSWCKMDGQASDQEPG